MFFAEEKHPMPGKPVSIGTLNLRNLNTLRRTVRRKAQAAGVVLPVSHAGVATLDLACRALDAGTFERGRRGIVVHLGGAR